MNKTLAQVLCHLTNWRNYYKLRANHYPVKLTVPFSAETWQWKIHWHEITLKTEVLIGQSSINVFFSSTPCLSTVFVPIFATSFVQMDVQAIGGYWGCTGPDFGPGTGHQGAEMRRLWSHSEISRQFGVSITVATVSHQKKKAGVSLSEDHMISIWFISFISSWKGKQTRHIPRPGGCGRIVFHSTWGFDSEFQVRVPMPSCDLHYHLVIKHSNGKSIVNWDLNENIIYKWVTVHCNVWLPEGISDKAWRSSWRSSWKFHQLPSS